MSAWRHGCRLCFKQRINLTNANWNTPQTITVTPVSDVDLADESVTITLSVNDGSSDDDFDPLADQTVTALVIDDDSAGFTVTESGGSMSRRKWWWFIL
ncbi:MAG: hypothetical protein R3A45_03020 [Bdellovibrionota bacterium]